MDKEYIYRKAISVWGVAAQTDMVIEECAELIKALQKRKRNPNNPTTVDSILEEMVDVEIMLEQLKIIYDYDYSGESHFETTKKTKLRRLVGRLQ